MTSVTLVSTNRQTLDGLETYLRGAGLPVSCARTLAFLTRLARGQAHAVVLFPDDYRWEKVVSALADLAALRPPALVVLVTAQPQRFVAVPAPDDVIVMPRPVWGSTILDVIRAQADRREELARAQERQERNEET